MKFVYPYFLFALFLILIPIIVHLFSFRRHKVIYFSNVRFLKDVKQQTKSINKLKHLLVLISRILFISFLVFAFAQPYIPFKNKLLTTGKNAVSIYIDNSFSMEALNENGSLLADAKIKASEIIKAYGHSDKFQLLTNQFEAKHQRLLSKEEFLQMLEEVSISPIVKNISEVISRQNDLLKNSLAGSKQIFLISDFQKTTSNMANIKPDTAISYTLVPVESHTHANVYIDSVWFESPVRSLFQPEKLWVKIINQSGKIVEDVPLKLTLNHQTIAPASFSVEAENETLVPLVYNNKKTGHTKGIVSINDYPVVFDDSFYFTYHINKNIPVMAIYGKEENKFINALFTQDSSIAFTSQNEKNIDYSTLGKQGLIILYDIEKISSGLSTELKRFVEEQGGYLLVFPSEKADLESYNNFLALLKSVRLLPADSTQRKVNALNTKHRIFSNVFEKTPTQIDLPLVNKHYPINRFIQSSTEDILKLNNGSDFLVEQKCNKGSLFICSSPLNLRCTNFSSHAIFVPTLYNLALNSVQTPPLFYTIGNNSLIEINHTSHSEKPVVIEGNGKQLIPGIVKRGFSEMLQTHNHITNAGFYGVINETDTIASIAFNFNRNESDTRAYTSGELNEIIQKYLFKNVSLVEPTTANVTKFIAEKNKGLRLWKLCIILALVFISIEIALLKFWK
ncbi:MAG: BatA domain-containing protein [Flavobacteriales bacterium]|nr:BatA domain-containing protein [Flavobacteriales bacterium]